MKVIKYELSQGFQRGSAEEEEEEEKGKNARKIEEDRSRSPSRLSQLKKLNYYYLF